MCDAGKSHTVAYNCCCYAEWKFVLSEHRELIRKARKNIFQKSKLKKKR